MKLSYKMVAGGGGYLVLLDEAASGNTAFPRDFAPKFTATVQSEPLFQANVKSRSPQGAVEAVLPVTLDVAYASVLLALASIKTVAALMGVGKLFHLKVEEGGDVSYYPNAVLKDYSPVVTGVSVTHSMSFNTDKVSATEV